MMILNTLAKTLRQLFEKITTAGVAANNQWRAHWLHYNLNVYNSLNNGVVLYLSPRSSGWNVNNILSLSIWHFFLLENGVAGGKCLVAPGESQDEIKYSSPAIAFPTKSEKKLFHESGIIDISNGTNGFSPSHAKVVDADMLWLFFSSAPNFGSTGSIRRSIGIETTKNRNFSFNSSEFGIVIVMNS